MSFSSAEWTIPELCVWIATGNRSAVNGLSSDARESLKYSDIVHNGAYAARDEVIEAAQQGKIIITCASEANRYQSNPERMKLPRDFWTNAELEDAGHYETPGSYWCVARRIDQPNMAKKYHDLLVDSAKAKEVWSPGPRAELATAAPADLLAEQQGAPHTALEPKPTVLMAELSVRRRQRGKSTNRDPMVIAFRREHPEIPHKTAKAAFTALPKELKGIRGRQKGSKNRNSGRK